MSRRYQIASESFVIVYFGNTIDPLISKEVQKAYQALKANVLEGFYEIIPSYASLMVSYDVMRFDFHEVCDIMDKVIHHAEEITMNEPKIALRADTLCVHGDNEEAVKVVETLRKNM